MIAMFIYTIMVYLTTGYGAYVTANFIPEDSRLLFGLALFIIGGIMGMVLSIGQYYQPGVVVVANMIVAFVAGCMFHLALGRFVNVTSICVIVAVMMALTALGSTIPGKTKFRYSWYVMATFFIALILLVTDNAPLLTMVILTMPCINIYYVTVYGQVTRPTISNAVDLGMSNLLTWKYLILTSWHRTYPFNTMIEPKLNHE